MEVITTKNKMLPNANMVLVLGILSLVFGCGVGLILGIIGLISSKEGMRLWRENPKGWDGYGPLNAGRIMSIIGICISGLVVVYLVIVAIFFGAFIAPFVNF